MNFDLSAWNRWNEWLDSLNPVISEMLVDSDRFNRLKEIRNANLDHITTHKGGEFVAIIRDWYISHQTVAVRRIVKADKQSISLSKLLDQVAKCAKQITLDFYLQQHPEDPTYVDWQTPTFNQLSEDGETISETIVSGILDNLTNRTRKIEDWVDRVVCHNDKRGPQDTPLFDELHDAVEAIDEAYCKIGPFITTKGYSTLRPTDLTDWSEFLFYPFAVNEPNQSTGGWG